MKRRMFKQLAKSIAVLTAASLYAAPLSLPSAVGGVPAAVCEASSYIDEDLRPIRPTVTIIDCVDTDGEGGELLRTRWNEVDVGAQPGEFSALRDTLRQYNGETAWLAVDTRKNMTGMATAVQDDMPRCDSGPRPVRAYSERSSTFGSRNSSSCLKGVTCLSACLRG